MTEMLNMMKRRIQTAPDAKALIRGSSEYPTICGTVRFYQTPYGVLVTAAVSGVPSQNGIPRVTGFHIHAGNRCCGNAQDAFADVGEHYNPSGREHPFHAGDLPPLFFGRCGALMTVLSDRFCVRDIVGKTVVLHAHADDLMTQPSGNSGTKIACGKIVRYR